MVRYFGPKEVATAVIQHQPEVVLKPGKVNALLVGSGIPAKLSIPRKLALEIALRRALKEPVPKVIDAGALYLLHKNSKYLSSPTIITPHNGELAVLLEIDTQEIATSPIAHAKAAAKRFDVVVLLKGYETILTDGNRVIKMPAASSWLATAGTGDVLAGLLGALIALNNCDASIEIKNKELLEIGATAAFIHAQAADALKGPVISSNLIPEISKIIKNLSR